jgi:transposase-like protein
LRCSGCRYTFKPKFRSDSRLLRKIIQEFVLEHSTNIILSRVKVSKYKLLKILTSLRREMTRDLPKAFSGIVEVDETYIGGKWKNRSLKNQRHLAKIKRGRGTPKQPVFGILCRQGKVYAEVVESVEAKKLQPIIEKRVKKGSVVCSDTWRGYTGIATKGYVHRLVNHAKQGYSDKRGHHINGLEGFWGYLKRKLKAKGGIRKSKLPIYLGEYIWRYNQRKLSLKEQENLLFKLISDT